jgi:hypothetical protein
MITTLDFLTESNKKIMFLCISKIIILYIILILDKKKKINFKHFYGRL